MGWTSHYLDTVATSNSNLYPLPDASRFSVQDGHDSSPISPDIPFDQDPEISPPPLEVVPLLVSGSSANRVDFVFFSDGCKLRSLKVLKCLTSSTDIAEERDKFVTDALRLAEDVSKNQTFNTVQPLLNFWAAFTPSKEVSTLLQSISNLCLLTELYFPEWHWSEWYSEEVRIHLLP